MEGLKKTAAAVIILAIIAGAVLLVLHRSRPTEIIVSAGTVTDEKRVGVFGAVRTPGYYSYEGDIRIGEAAELAGGLTEDADPSAANLAQWVNDGETILIPTVGGPVPTLTPPVPDEMKIDLNSATLEELMTLPGIGEKRAAEIIRLREEKGRFERPEDILESSMISEKLLGSIYDRLIVR